MSIENALKIDGWMDVPELEWLAQQAPKCKRIAEIGSWLGRSTRALADNTTGLVYAIDTWEGSEEQQELLLGKPDGWLFWRFRENVQSLSNVIPMRTTSLEAASWFKHCSMNFDMVFIDAAHDYESVKADILAWGLLIQPGGILCGHDSEYPPVEKAVKEVLGSVSKAKAIWYMEVR